MPRIPLTLREVVGENARAARERRGMSREQVTAEARRYGVPLSSDRLGDLEAGNASTLRIEEALVLCLVLRTEFERLMECSNPVIFGTHTYPPKLWQDIVTGSPLADEQLDQLQPSRPPEAPATEAERKMARRLCDTLHRKVTWWDVRKAARSHWGRTLDEERESRLANRITNATSRTVRTRLRQQVSRELADDLAGPLDADLEARDR